MIPSPFVIQVLPELLYLVAEIGMFGENEISVGEDNQTLGEFISDGGDST